MRLTTEPRRILQRLRDSYVEFHIRAPFKLPAVGVIGLLAFPIYYVVWQFLFPQPFESVALRTVGTLLCGVLALANYWPRALKPYRLAYAYVALMYSLPVFFTTMLLMNGGNAVWLMSTMAALLFFVLLYDLANVLVVGTIGSGLGIALYWWFSGGQPLPENYLIALPVFAFTIAAIAFLAHSERVISHEKLTAAYALASNIAHEMRTPLLGIKLDAEKLRSSLPGLLDANGAGTEIAALQGTQIDAALGRICEHTEASNLVIDMLLMNLTHSNISPEQFGDCAIRSTLAKALDRYHFRPGERELVHIDRCDDFIYFGSDLLMQHVVFNLIKNALRAIEAKGSGSITITAITDRSSNRIVVRDSGEGIPPDVMPYIFVPFVGGGGGKLGTGIGLSFCRWVIDSFGGSITCRSHAPHGTEFTLTLPLAVGQVIASPLAGGEAVMAPPSYRALRPLPPAEPADDPSAPCGGSMASWPPRARRGSQRTPQ